MCHISKRLKNRLTMLGVKYMVIAKGKTQKGDLILRGSMKTGAKRWHKVHAENIGLLIRELDCLVKRPLENIS